MTTVNKHIRAHLVESFKETMPSPEILADSETSAEFTALRRNRKVFGAMRYGRMGSKGKPQYDRVACMIRRLEAYRSDRNAEHLVDVSNLAELEFVEGDHLGVLSIDDGIHTELVNERPNSLRRHRRIRCRKCQQVFAANSLDPECGNYPTLHKDRSTGEWCRGVEFEGKLVSQESQG